MTSIASNFEITGPDDDGLLWLVLHGSGTTGRAMFNLGQASRLAGQVAMLFEADRRAALAAPAPQPEPSRAQLMREAGYTRRPTLRELPSDVAALQPEPVGHVYTMEALDSWSFDGSGPRCHVRLYEDLPAGTKLFTSPSVGAQIRPQPLDPALAQHVEHCLWARNGHQPCPHVNAKHEP